jgi:hypothetical protein
VPHLCHFCTGNELVGYAGYVPHSRPKRGQP